MDPQLAVQIVALIFLLFCSGFFSSAETAFTTVNQIQIQLLADEGDKRALKVLKILEQSPKMLSTILVMNNLVNMSASSLATTMTIALFGNAYVGVATGILTFLVLIFGEITPKSMAAVYAKQLSLTLASLVWVLMKLLTPIIWIIDLLRIGLLKLLHIDPDARDTMTEEELKTLVDVGHEEGAIEADEFEMISNVFDLDDSLARDIMIPRVDMVFIHVDSSYEELLEIYKEHHYTRYPVYQENTDIVIGTINIKDLLTFPEEEEFTVRKILRKPHFSFEHKEIGTLLLEMRKESISLLIILDEYGATSGMITMEDILEEIVGEIRDEYDKDETDAIRPLRVKGEYLIDGAANLDDVNDCLKTEFVSQAYDSMGGFVIEYLDRLPKSGECITLADGTRIITEVVRRNRVEKVHVILPVKEENTQDKK